MKTLRKLALAVCTFIAIAISSSCNKEEMQTEKLLGKWDIIMDKDQVYENGVMVKKKKITYYEKKNIILKNLKKNLLLINTIFLTHRL